jgi:hypothetical protein
MYLKEFAEIHQLFLSSIRISNKEACFSVDVENWGWVRDSLRLKLLHIMIWFRILRKASSWQDTFRFGWKPDSEPSLRRPLELCITLPLHPTAHDAKQTNLIEMRTPYQSQASFKGSIISVMIYVLTAPIFAINVDIYTSEGNSRKIFILPS